MDKTSYCVVCNGCEFQTLVNRIVDYEYELSIPDISCVQCNSCGLITLNPLPTIVEVRTFYPDTYANYYAYETNPSRISQFLIDRYNSSLVSFFAPFIREGDTVLEVGCATGRLLYEMKRAMPSCKYMGVEINAYAADIARQRGLNVITGSIEEADLECNSISLVILSHLIEHSPDPPSLLAKLTEALKSGGHIYIETPNSACLSRMLFGKYWGGYHFPRHTFLFTRENLRRLLSNFDIDMRLCQDTLHSFGWSLSIQNFLSDLYRINKKNGRAWFYGLLMMGFTPLAIFLRTVKSADALRIVGRKR